MKKQPLYTHIAQTIRWYNSCTDEWRSRVEDKIDLASAALPSGSGIDCGAYIDRYESRTDRIRLRFSFHHMDDVGCYTHWTEHWMDITPCLCDGFELQLHGGDITEGLTDYLYDVFNVVLLTETEL